MPGMSTDKLFPVHYSPIDGVDYLFCPSIEKSRAKNATNFTRRYFESHHQRLTAHGWALFVDLRPAFRKPLADVTPEIRAISRDELIRISNELR
jgi:hypothetical protein